MERLAELRERRALALRELSAKSGVAADTINQIELGHRKPRPSTLRKLAKALGVEVEDFFRESETPKGAAPLSRATPEGAAEERRIVNASARFQGRASVQAKATVVQVPRNLYLDLLDAVEGRRELDSDKLRQAHEVLVHS